MLQIAYAQLENNRKINDEKQQERLEKALATDDEEEIKKILDEAQEKIALNKKTSNVEGYVSLAITIVLIVTFTCAIKNTESVKGYKYAEINLNFTD